MYAFALTAVGAVVIGAVMEFFLIDGDIKKYTSMAMSLIIIVILITPVIGIFSSGITMSDSLTTDKNTFTLDENLLSETNKARCEYLVALVDKTFLDLKLKAKVLDYEVGDVVLIKKLNISTLDAVITGDDLNIVDTEDIVAVVQKVLKDNIESIVVDGEYVGADKE